MNLFNNLFLMLGVFLTLAFFTLVERKIMGYMQFRMGPNKISLYGILLPMADAMKLMTKEMMKVSFTKTLMYTMAPMISLMLMLVSWMSFESSTTISSEPKIVAMVALFTMSHFIILFMGWGSYSNYPKLGALRTLVMAWSFEICFFIILVVFFYMTKSVKILHISEIQSNLKLFILFTPMMMSWMMCVLAESNRTPFDLAEGESEIVSGMNTEYLSGLFSLFFVTEYGLMLLWSCLTSFLFMGGDMIYLKTISISFLLVWVRCSFPRIRTDNFMLHCWNILFYTSVMFLLILM